MLSVTRGGLGKFLKGFLEAVIGAASSGTRHFATVVGAVLPLTT